MAKQFLVPFDDSEQAHRALEHALTEHSNGDITALHVLNPAEWGYGSPNSGLGKRWYEKAETESEEIQSSAVELAGEYGTEITTTAESGVPSDVITEYADDHDTDHIVIGSHGRSGTKRLVLGSVRKSLTIFEPIRNLRFLMTLPRRSRATSRFP